MRWTHWVNFPILTIMIWSGMLIYWANDEYTVTLFGHTYVRFFPDWYYNCCISRSAWPKDGFSFPVHVVFYAEWDILHTIYHHIRRVAATGTQRHSFKEAWLVLAARSAYPQNRAAAG